MPKSVNPTKTMALWLFYPFRWWDIPLIISPYSQQQGAHLHSHHRNRRRKRLPLPYCEHVSLSLRWPVVRAKWDSLVVGEKNWPKKNWIQQQNWFKYVKILPRLAFPRPILQTISLLLTTSVAKTRLAGAESARRTHAELCRGVKVKPSSR